MCQVASLRERGELGLDTEKNTQTVCMWYTGELGIRRWIYDRYNSSSTRVNTVGVLGWLQTSRGDVGAARSQLSFCVCVNHDVSDVPPAAMR